MLAESGRHWLFSKLASFIIGILSLYWFFGLLGRILGHDFSGMKSTSNSNPSSLKSSCLCSSVDFYMGNVFVTGGLKVLKPGLRFRFLELTVDLIRCLIAVIEKFLLVLQKKIINSCWKVNHFGVFNHSVSWFFSSDS